MKTYDLPGCKKSHHSASTYTLFYRVAQANVVIFFIQNVITVWCYSLRDIDFWSVGARSVVEGTKGQLISKCLFAVFNCFQKMNVNKSTLGIIIVKSICFVRFLEETLA